MSLIAGVGCQPGPGLTLWRTALRTGGKGMSEAKDELTQLIQRQPEDSSREDIVREPAFHVMVAHGLANSAADGAPPIRAS